MDKEKAKQEIAELIDRFSSHQSEYKLNDYLESQLRTDFIDELFKILGWDLVNKNKLSPLQREVLVEKGDTKGRPDYSFRVNGEDRFFVEAKAPSKGTDKPDDIFQAKRYGWNTRKVNIAILTDFRTFKVFDASLKPQLSQSRVCLLFELEYSKFATSDFERLWLFSREQVVGGSLDSLSLKDASVKRLRVPVDVAFLEQMTLWREKLAKDIYKNNLNLEVRDLNDVVQKLLDRIVFIRILEDRKIIEAKSLKEIVENWEEAKHRDIQPQLNALFKQLNNDFNGEIFKDHSCEIVKYDSQVIAEIISELYYPKSPYDFSVIGVELLGVIYEKYLGKTIHMTEKRIKVEEKPEVRKAGGVFYTPKYIVESIVNNTVGKLIEGKSPKEISNLHILDPACGSGSFLIGTLEHLFHYYLNWYLENPKDAKRGTLFPNLIIERDVDDNATYRLSIEKKSEILRNNIYGVDIDPQAVEITMMSLYIKVLEGEKSLPHNKELLPSLFNNIKCGNSLIGFDIFEQQTLFGEPEKEKINSFEWKSKTTGFGKVFEENDGFDAIVGNPPYVRSILLKEEPITWEYYRKHYRIAFKEFDIYLCFLEKGYSLLAPNGRLGFIMPNKWLHAKMGEAARKFFRNERAINSIVNFGSFQIFDEATTYTMLIFLEKKNNLKISVTNYSGSLEKKQILFSSKNEVWQHGSFDYATLTSEPWNFVTGKANVILEKLKKLPKFGEYFSLAQGTGTRADDVFFIKKISETEKYYKIFSNYTEKEHTIEKDYVKPSAKGKDIDSYEVKFKDNLLIFPYRNKEFIEKKELEKICPKLVDYLNECKEFLDKREKGRWKGPNFYCYGRPQNHNLLPQQKILVPVIVNRAKAAWDQIGRHVIDSVYFVKRKRPSDIAEEYVLALLNSDLLSYFLLNTSSNLRGGYFSMKPGYVEPFPFKATFLTNDEKQSYEEIVKIVKRINLLNQNSGTFRRELDTYKEIVNQFIYKLYGITEEEKKIIEESLK